MELSEKGDKEKKPSEEELLFQSNQTIRAQLIKLYGKEEAESIIGEDNKRIKKKSLKFQSDQTIRKELVRLYGKKEAKRIIRGEKEE